MTGSRLSAGLGLALLVVGLLALGYGTLWQLGLAPGSRVALPAPVALAPADVGPWATRPTTIHRPTAVQGEPVSMQPLEPAPSAPEPTTQDVPPAVALQPVAADAGDRADAVPPETGYAVRLAIPAINLDTQVEQAGIVDDADGDPVWQTVPFIAVHYGDLTSLVGAPGNAVIAGHVVTLSQGNVFRFLYKLDLEDQVQVWDDQQIEHDFHVVDVRLVPPSDTSVMEPTPDETLTLITCGGTFDPVRREFSDRLIVTAKPLH